MSYQYEWEPVRAVAFQILTEDLYLHLHSAYWHCLCVCVSASFLTANDAWVLHRGFLLPLLAVLALLVASLYLLQCTQERYSWIRDLPYLPLTREVAMSR